MPAPFLRAEWRNLVLLNYEVDPSLLAAWIPRGTELDLWQGAAFVSVVAFLFLDTRVLGWSIPFHRDFEEVNLRFYVRRAGPEGWRRGVVFVKEMVPRAAIAWTARMLYGERYVAVPMSHRLECSAEGWPRAVEYAWKRAGREERVRLVAEGAPGPLRAGSHEEFIAEHYWGYARQRDGGTLEYRVEHPRWSFSPARTSHLECDVEALYGCAFESALGSPPASAFLALGSEVVVHRGARCAP